MRQVKNKLINVSYKGILRISPNTDGEDWGAQEYFDVGQEIVVSDSDGTNLPITFTGDGVRVDGTFRATGDATFSNVVTFNGNVNAVGELKTQNLNVAQTFNVDGTSIFNGRVTMNENLDVSGETNLGKLKIEDKNLYVKHGLQEYNLNLGQSLNEDAYVLQFGSSTIETYPLRKKLKEYGYNAGTGGGGGTSTGSSGQVGDVKMSFMGFSGNEKNDHLKGWLPLTGTICNSKKYWKLYEHLYSAFGEEEFCKNIILTDDWFQLPDIRGMFPRFANTTTYGYDAGRKAGTIQSSASPNISGSFGGNTDDVISAGGKSYELDGSFYVKKVNGATNADGALNGGGFIGFDATRSSTVYRTYDVDKYPLTEEDKLAMKGLDDKGKLDYVQKKIEGLPEGEREMYWLNEVRPVNYPFNAYIYTGEVIENNCDYQFYFDIDERVKKETDSGTVESCLEVGKIAAKTKRERYTFSDCKNKQALLEKGFDGSKYIIFNDNLISLQESYSSNLQGSGIFGSIGSNGILKAFTCDLPLLRNGREMFYGNPYMTTFVGTLKRLETAPDMFLFCSIADDSLEYIANELPSTTNGVITITSGSTTVTENIISSQVKMNENGWQGGVHFYNVTTPKVELPNNFKNVTSGYQMFYGNKNITEVVGDFSGLKDGKKMFISCPKLNKFINRLPSLEDGCGMFEGCCLSLESICEIVETLPSYSEWTHTIDIVTNHIAIPSTLVPKVAEWKRKLEEKGWHANIQIPKVQDGIIEGDWMTNVKDGTKMFKNADQYSNHQIRGAFNILENGRNMFENAKFNQLFDPSRLVNEVSFPELVNGFEMFKKCKIMNINISLPKLTNGAYMFSESTLSGLAGNQREADGRWPVPLGSLTNGYYMFKGCNLLDDSVLNLAAGIKDVNVLEDGENEFSEVYKVIHIGMVAAEQTVIKTSNKYKTGINEIINKGWTVYINTEPNGKGDYVKYDQRIP